MNIDAEKFEELRKLAAATVEAIKKKTFGYALLMACALSNTLIAIEDRHLAETIGEYADDDDEGGGVTCG